MEWVALCLFVVGARPCRKRGGRMAILLWSSASFFFSKKKTSATALLFAVSLATSPMLKLVGKMFGVFLTL